MNHAEELKLVQVQETDEVRALIPAVERFVDTFIAGDEAANIAEMVKFREDILGWIRYYDTAVLGENLPASYVPATQWLTVKTKNGISEVVGKISMRHWLMTHNLAEFLGHIGYAVHPGYRRRGIATWQLRSCLAEIRKQVDSGQMFTREGVFCSDSQDISEFPPAAKPSVENVAVLLTCNESNVGSYKTIETCGGIRDRNGTVDNPNLPSFGTVKRRYWIELPASDSEISSTSGSTK